jgi:hypothetical protein
MESKILLTSIFVSITALILGVSFERYLFRVVSEFAPNVWSSLIWQTVYIIALFIIVIILALSLIPKLDRINVDESIHLWDMEDIEPMGDVIEKINERE